MPAANSAGWKEVAYDQASPWLRGSSRASGSERSAEPHGPPTKPTRSPTATTSPADQNKWAKPAQEDHGSRCPQRFQQLKLRNSGYNANSNSDRTTNGSVVTKHGTDHTGAGSTNATAAGDAGTASPNNVGPIGGEFAMEARRTFGRTVQSANDPDKLFLVCAAVDNNAEMKLAATRRAKIAGPQVRADCRADAHTGSPAGAKQAEKPAQATACRMPQGVSPAACNSRRRRYADAQWKGFRSAVHRQRCAPRMRRP